MLLRVPVAILLVSQFASAATAGPPNILVWQPQHTASESGAALRDDLLTIGENPVLSDDLFEFSPDLSDYEIVMGVMGTTPDTHLLTVNEADALETFVQNGGRLLLEGADVFNYDPDVSGGIDIRNMFGLGTGTDGDGVFSGNFVGIGALGSFEFDYFGEPSFLDELEPVTSTPLLRKQNNQEIHAVYLPSYGLGSTIGISCEYAGLRDPVEFFDLTLRHELLAEFLELLRSGQPVAAPDPSRGLVLHAVTPNPVRGATTIRFDLPRPTDACIDIYNVAGRLVRRLGQAAQGPGTFTTRWNGRDERGQPVASGVYIIALEAGAETAWSKVVVLR